MTPGCRTMEAFYNEMVSDQETMTEHLVREAALLQVGTLNPPRTPPVWVSPVLIPVP